MNATTGEPTVLYDAHDAVAVVTMNRPQYRNAQNARMTFELDTALLRAAGDDRIKVIVLAGAAVLAYVTKLLHVPVKVPGESSFVRPRAWSSSRAARSGDDATERARPRARGRRLRR